MGEFPKKKQRFMMGNEALAEGAYEGGVAVGAGYPGTPSSEILEFLNCYSGVDVRWCPNEKVALEVAAGAAIGGKRALVTMKHVGLNVAADPLMTVAYTGVRAGLVIIVADDPGMYSSQNEQDSRNYAVFAKIPCLEPANSEEARLFLRTAFELSETFDTPLLIRSTTHVSHSKGLVNLEERKSFPGFDYARDANKYVMIPVFARIRRHILEERMDRIKKWVETTPLNRVEMRDQSLGIITGGVLYEYIREVLPDASVLKLGVSFPLPLQKIKTFTQAVERVVVVEELDPIWEREMRAAGISVVGKEIIPVEGEITPDVLQTVFGVRGNGSETVNFSRLVPNRPPVMCAGCPHRGVLRVLADLKAVVAGDIGCSTLGVMPPLSAIDSCICMGASISMAEGFKLAHPDLPVAAVIGDSTFIHGGIPPLIDAVYNQTNIVVVILDNRITAMTGGQQNPGTGVTLSGKKGHALDFGDLCRSIGVPRVEKLSSYDLKTLRPLLQQAFRESGPTVLIVSEPCQLIRKEREPVRYRITPEKCRQCQRCLKLGCPAISQNGEVIQILSETCRACGVCQSQCAFEAIEEVTD
ncbi:MAG: indolepyruvate ferredoxin oxidoreductase subunit alpha [Candidatus Atribacteria bacterium]|nr:indolepyruvate ferredoxin oxidoreductase subunit alpha [Candidatus Atribacteria bacterium]